MQNKFKIINLESFEDERGILVSLLNNNNLPFELKRIYYIFAKKNAERANLAHKTQKQILICLSGSCKVLLKDGKTEEIIELSNPAKALYIENMIWRKIFDFSENSALISLNNEDYDENEIIRNYDEFLQLSQ